MRRWLKSSFWSITATQAVLAGLISYWTDDEFSAANEEVVSICTKCILFIILPEFFSFLCVCEESALNSLLFMLEI